jgi:hypothetical protein
MPLSTTGSSKLVASFKGTLVYRAPNDRPYSAQLTYSVTRNDDQAVVILFS